MTTLVLPPNCDRVAVGELAADLPDALAKGPVEIDGSAVTAFGQCAIQLLLSARRTADLADVALQIVPSAPMSAALRLTGADALLLGSLRA